MALTEGAGIGSVRGYKVTLVDGRSDTITGPGPVHVSLKPALHGGGYSLSIRGNGFESLDSLETIKSLTDLDSGADVIQRLRQSVPHRSPITMTDCEPYPITESSPSRMASGALPFSCEPESCAADPFCELPGSFLSDNAYGCFPYYSQCGDDGDGSSYGYGLVINFPSGFCYYDFPDGVPDCYSEAGDPPFPAGKNYFSSWDNGRPSSVAIHCMPTGTVGRFFAFYTEPGHFSFETSIFSASRETYLNYPTSFHETRTPGPLVTINVNFYKYGVPLDSFYLGYCNYTG